MIFQEIPAKLKIPSDKGIAFRELAGIVTSICRFRNERELKEKEQTNKKGNEKYMENSKENKTEDDVNTVVKNNEKELYKIRR